LCCGGIRGYERGKRQNPKKHNLRHGSALGLACDQSRPGVEELDACFVVKPLSRAVLIQIKTDQSADD